MDSNHELDRFFELCKLLILRGRRSRPKASKAGPWYKIGTKYYPLELKVERELETPRAKSCERLQKTKSGRGPRRKTE
jgi:hypothetical protein